MKTEEGRWQEASLSCSLEYNNGILLRVACREPSSSKPSSGATVVLLGLTVTPGAANQSLRGYCSGWGSCEKQFETSRSDCQTSVTFSTGIVVTLVGTSMGSEEKNGRWD